MSWAVFFFICLLISGITIRIAISIASLLGVMDKPGGHKQHDTSTPFVGGVGVMTALISTLYLTRFYFPVVAQAPLDVIATGAGVIFLTGLADDIWQLNFRTRFLFQAAVALYMVFMGGVVLGDLGELIPGQRLELGMLAIPFTVFATIGVINALNMIDGIDGLSGSLSLVSLILTGLIAFLADNYAYFMLAIALIGGVVGFLYYNLRYPTNKRARVFLGDNGSMLLGLLFAWMFIGLSQGPHRAMAPATALWLFAMPLMDTVCVMLRRIWMSKSPFRADRNHLHHLFLRADFRVTDTVTLLVLIQLLLGLVGVAGLWLSVPDSLMFAGFLLTFAIYFYIIVRPWRLVPSLRCLNVYFGLPSVQARGIYIGYVRRNDARKLTDILASELGDRYEYRLSLHETDPEARDGRSIYGILEMPSDHDSASLGEIKHLKDRLKVSLAGWHGLKVRQFMQRNSENNRRSRNGPIDDKNSRKSDRRALGNKILIQTLGLEGAKVTHPSGLPI